MNHAETNVHMEVSLNKGTPKSSILVGFSVINQLFSGTPFYGNLMKPPGLALFPKGDAAVLRGYAFQFEGIQGTVKRVCGDAVGVWR